MKRILSVILSVTLLCSLVPGGVAAANDKASTMICSEDFTGVTASATEQTLASGVKLTGGVVRYGVGGRASDDASIDLYDGGKLILASFNPLTYKNDGLVIEFSIFKSTTSYTYLNAGSDSYQLSPCFRSSSSKPAIIGGDSKNYGAYELNRWYHAAIEVVDFTTGAYNFYLNGVLKSTDDTVGRYYWYTSATRAFGITAGKAVIDDIRIYTGTYSNSNAQAEVTSSVLNVDSSAKTASALDMPVGEYLKLVSVSKGAAARIMDSETFVVKSADSVVESGDYLAVCAPDGVNYSYYKLTYDPTVMYYSEDFTDVTADGTDDAQALSDATLINGVAETSVGGKSSSDVSIKLESDAASLYKDDINFSSFQKATIEYNLLKWEASSSGAPSVDDSVPFPIFAEGSILAEGSAIGSFELNQWQHIAIDMDIAGGKYDYYVNRVCLAQGLNLPAEFAADAPAPLYFVKGQGYIDDIKIYSSSYAPPSLGGFTVSGGAKSDEAHKLVALYATVDATELSDYVTPSDGSTISVVSKTDGKTKTSGTIQLGDYLAVCAPDGVTYSYYQFTDRVYDDFDMISCKAKSDGTELVADDISAGDNVQFEYVVQNINTEAPRHGALIFVVYENDALVYCDIQNITVDAGATDKAFTSTSVYRACASPDAIEVYLWKSMTERTPLIKAHKMK